MATRLNFIILCVVTFVSLTAAQGFTVPKGYTLQTKEDYQKYEPDVLACVKFLETAPLDSAEETRKEANAFLLQWVSGSPTVNIDIQGYLMELTKENKDFLLIFMGGWVTYALESKDYSNKFNGHLAGLRAILRVYQNTKGVKSDSAVDELVSLDKAGKLESWLRDKLQ